MSPWLYSDYFWHFSLEYWKSKRAIQVLHRSTEAVIKKRQESQTDVNLKYKDFLQILLDCRDMDGNPLTFKEIRDEVKSINIQFVIFISLLKGRYFYI